MSHPTIELHVHLEGTVRPDLRLAIFAGYCDGAQEALERHGVRVLLTPDIGRSFTMEEAEMVTRHAIRHRDRGVVGLGLGGLEAGCPPSRSHPSSPGPGPRGWPRCRTPARWRAPSRCTGAVRSLAEHPLPRLIEAGVACSLATDDPAMFGTDLGREHAVAAAMGLDPRGFYEAGVRGALCDEATRSELRAIGEAARWPETSGAR